MRRKSDYTWFWNTGQDFTRLLILVYILLVCTSNSTAYPDFIDSMSRQFFGLPDDANTQQNQQYQQNPNPLSQMFGSHSQPVPARPPSPPQHHNQRRPEHSPQRQGYYPPHPGSYQQPYHPQPPRPHHSQRHPPYNGPPPVYGQQHGFGQVKTEGNETKTEGFPGDEKRGQHATASYPPPVHRKQHLSTEYHIQDPHQTAIEYHHPPATAIEYQQPPVEYQHIPEHAVEYHPAPQHLPVEEHHGPAIQILSEPHHHEPPEHVEYHHEPEHHHYPEKKPKRFHISFHQSPDYKIVDKHLKLPPVKFRFHINPKIVITSNTKDPLDKKHHHDEEHDLEPYPPPDAFSDHDAPPSYNEHTVEHYPTEHHYPVHHHSPYPAEHHFPAEHHPHHDASGYSGGKFHPLEQHPPAYPRPQHTYDLSAGHSHVNPHRSGGHYEPTFKIKTRPIIFTEPPPTPRTTTRRPTTTTARTTTTTTTTTTRRPRSRSNAGLNARNPTFTAAFTQSGTAKTTSIERQGEVSDTTTSTSTTRRSIFGNNSERERENGVITSRKDESTSITTASTTPSTTTTTTTTTKKPTTSTTTTTTTIKPTTSTTTTTTPKPTTTTTTKPVPTTTTTTTQKPTTTTTPFTSRATPAEETTLRTTTTINVDANEIDMRKDTDVGRRRPEPLKEESLTTVERTFNFENSESVKVIETTMLIDGKNQTVKFYYITQPVKLPLDVFQRMTGQKKNGGSGINVIKIRDKRFAMDVENLNLNHKV